MLVFFSERIPCRESRVLASLYPHFIIEGTPRRGGRGQETGSPLCAIQQAC